jgi:hypothetical protein
MELPEHDFNLDNTDGYVPTAGSPLNTDWHEIWPTFSTAWEMTSWVDLDGDGMLSVKDSVDFNGVSDQKYIVEWIGPTIIVDVDTYLEYMSFDKADMSDITDPVGTAWHEVYDTYSTTWIVISWTDDGDGILGAGDQLVLENVDTEAQITVPVIDIKTDIILRQVRNCCTAYGIPGDANGDGGVNLTDILNAISFVYVEPLGVPAAFNGCNSLYDVNGDGANFDTPNVNLTDILNMISHVYVVPLGEPVLCCPPGCITP